MVGFCSRSSCLHIICKKGVLRDFAKFTGKNLCQSLFFNIFFSKRDSGTCFTVSFAKVLRTFFLQNTSGGCFCGSSWSLPCLQIGWVGHRFKLETEEIIFHILQRNFPNFNVKILALCPTKSLWSFYFSLFHSQLVYTCSNHGVVQSLVRLFPKQIYIFFFFYL